jgi:hypothetical protein
MRVRLRSALLEAAAALTIGVAGCSGGGTTGVATLGTNSSSSHATTSAHAKLSAQEAATKFAECMRQHGVDIPDPTFSGKGPVVIQGNGSTSASGSTDQGGSGESTSKGSPEFQQAQQACQHFLDDAVNSAGGPKVSAKDQAKAQAAALKFAACMRKHGIDFPDPTINANGGITQALQIDPNDPHFQAAQDTCKKYLPGGGKGLTTNGGGPGGGATIGNSAG